MKITLAGKRGDINMEKIKKMIVVIIAGILLTTTSFTAFSDDTPLDGDTLDQSWETYDGWNWTINDLNTGAQSFKPLKPVLTRVELYIWKESMFTDGDFIVDIKISMSSPGGIVSSIVNAIDIGVEPGWIEFDLDDIIIEPDQTYYIVSTSKPIGGSFFWGGDDLTDPPSSGYDRGEAWLNGVIAPDYDFCFRTYGMELNQPPVANDDYYSVDEGGSLDVVAPGVLGNDVDGDGDPITASLVSGPSHDSSFALYPNGSFNYVHDGSESTSDSFTYLAYDGMDYSNIATVWITINPVNDPPVSNVDSYSVDEDNTLNVAVPGVLGNDNDPENNPLSAVLIEDVSHGSLTLNSDGSFDYDPNANFNGVDVFIYRAYDGILYSENASVTITVESINDIPIAFIDSISPNPTKYSYPVTFSGHGTDVEGDIVAYRWNSSIDGHLSDQNSFITSSLSLGVHTIHFGVQDEQGEWSEPNVYMTLTILENIPPIAYIDSISPNPAVEGAIVTFNGSGEDSDGTIVAYEWESNISGIFGTEALVTNSTLPFGTHNITFRVQDNDGVWSDLVNETLEILENMPPIANPDYVTVYNDTKDNKIDVLANDSDPDGDVINLTNVTQPQNGTARIENNMIRYTPDPGFYGVNILEYNITDSYGANATGIVTITVKNASKLSIVEPQQGYVYINGNPKFTLKFLLAFLDIDALAIGSITFKANITETEGSGEVGKVEFYVDDELKTSDTTYPYNWTWNEFAIGIYTVEIVVYDTEDNVMTRDSRDILIFNLRGEIA